MRKVFFIIPTLAGGGAERVFLHILRYMDRKRFEPRLVLFEKKGELLFDLSSDISVEVLRGNKSKYALKYFVFISLAKVLRKERPDAVICFMWYPNLITLLAKFLSRVKCGVIVSERTSTSIYESRFINFLRNFAIRFFYHKADIIISPSKGIAEDIILSGIPPKKVSVIHNPVDIAAIHNKSKEDIEHHWYKNKGNIVIAVGRLGREKGFDYLIKAISLLHEDGIDCRLVILGEGIERENLQNIVKKMGIEDKIDLEGFQPNPYKYISRSTLFVLSSLYEGFPNVLLEALSLGVPSVATRCPTGPEEIITDGVNGILVPPANEKALADAIKKLLQDEDLRKRLGEAGKKRAEDFRIDKIIKQYEDVIESVCAESAG